MRILYCTMSLVEASCVMPKVELGDETNLGESGRSSTAASTVPRRVAVSQHSKCSTPTKQCHCGSPPINCA